MATSLFPTNRRLASFFTEAPRRSSRISSRTEPAGPAHWLGDEDGRSPSRGTPYATFIARTARATDGASSALNMVADALHLPRRKRPPGTESTAAWSDSRQGWLFWQVRPPRADV